MVSALPSLDLFSQHVLMESQAGVRIKRDQEASLTIYPLGKEHISYCKTTKHKDSS